MSCLCYHSFSILQRCCHLCVLSFSHYCAKTAQVAAASPTNVTAATPPGNLTDHLHLQHLPHRNCTAPPLPGSLWNRSALTSVPWSLGNPSFFPLHMHCQSDSTRSSSIHRMLLWEKTESLAFCKTFNHIPFSEAEVKHALKHKIGPFLAAGFPLLPVIHAASVFANIDSLPPLWQLWCVNWYMRMLRHPAYVLSLPVSFLSA